MPTPRNNSSRAAIIVTLTFLVLCSLIPSSRAEEDRWWGVITAMTADENTYTVQTEDGRLFNIEWYAGYSGWDVYG
jgi:hypothetical protein